MAAKAPAAGRIGVRKSYKLFIGGAFPRTESGRYLSVQDAKGAFVADISRASRKDLREAVLAARKAFGGWSKRTAFNRGQILYRMAEMLEARRAIFERGLVELAGYSPKAATAEVDCAIDRVVWYSGWADKFTQVFGSTNPVAAPYFNFSSPEPVGVVTVLAPQNAPLAGLVSAILPVIVSGNAAIVVVDSAAPTLAIELAEVLATSDLPGGVVNILTGQRAELLGHVGSHADIDAVLCFGGQDGQRKALATAGAESVKRVHFMDDPDAPRWLGDDMQSPYWILPFVELKTAWHPIGA